MIQKFENFDNKPEPKFNIGDKVRYLPKLSGFNPNTKLVIKNVRFQEEDGLAKSMNVDSEPTYVYSFKGTNMNAVEKDLVGVHY